MLTSLPETWTYQHSPTLPRAPPPPRSLVASFFFGLPVPSASLTPAPATADTAPTAPNRRRPPPPPADVADSDNDDDSEHLRVTPQPRSSGTTFPSSAVSTGKGKGSSLMSVLSARREGEVDGGKLEVEGGGGKLEVEGGEEGKARRRHTGQGGGSMALFWMAGAAGGGTGRAGRGQQAGDLKGGGGAAVNAKRLHNKVRSEKEVRVDSKRRVRSWLGEVAACERPVVAEWDGEGLPIY